MDNQVAAAVGHMVATRTQTGFSRLDPLGGAREGPGRAAPESFRASTFPRYGKPMLLLVNRLRFPRPGGPVRLTCQGQAAEAAKGNGRKTTKRREGQSQ